MTLRNWFRPWRKQFAKKRITVEQFKSSEPTVRAKVEDYWERLIGDELYLAVVDEVENTRAVYIENLVKGGHISKGQWILWVSELFRTEMLNGGFEQFIGNWPRLGRDVSLCFRELGLEDFVSTFDEIGSQIVPLLSEAFVDENTSQQREAYDKLFDILDASPQVTRLNDEFLPDWGEDKDQCQIGKLSSSRLEDAMLAYIEDNYSEFCIPVRGI